MYAGPALLRQTYPMIELQEYVEDTKKCVFIFEPENFTEEQGYGLTIQCGITGKKSIVSNNGMPVYLCDENTTRLAIRKMNKQIGILSSRDEIEIRSMSLQPNE